MNTLFGTIRRRWAPFVLPVFLGAMLATEAYSQQVASPFGDAAPDLSIPIEEVRNAVSGKSADAHFELGMRYLTGEGVEPSLPSARGHLTFSATLGSAKAMAILGQIVSVLPSSKGQPDIAKAAEWYSTAIDHGSLVAKTWLSELVLERAYTGLDHSRAIALMHEAAESGEVLARVNLGRWYLNGLHVEMNREAAYDWYFAAAEAGSADAMTGLANMYMNGFFVERSDETACALMFRAVAYVASTTARETTINNGKFCYSKFGKEKSGELLDLSEQSLDDIVAQE